MRFESTEDIQELLDRTTSVENRLLTILYLLNGKFAELQTLSEQLRAHFKASQQATFPATGNSEAEK